MKTETIEDTVARRAQVDEGNNLCFDDMERDGEDAIRSVQALLEAVQKLRSILSSVKKQLNDEKMLRMKVQYPRLISNVPIENKWMVVKYYTNLSIQ